MAARLYFACAAVTPARRPAAASSAGTRTVRLPPLARVAVEDLAAVEDPACFLAAGFLDRRVGFGFGGCQPSAAWQLGPGSPSSSRPSWSTRGAGSPYRLA